MELLPCPFCGSDNVGLGEELKYYYILCSGCCFSTNQFHTENDVCKFWNTRSYMIGELKILDEKKYLPWISVKDRYPNEGDNVLTLSDGSIQIGFLYYDDGDPIDSSGITFRDHQDNYDIEYVTHWMPLPQPPKGTE